MNTNKSKGKEDDIPYGKSEILIPNDRDLPDLSKGNDNLDNLERLLQGSNRSISHMNLI